MLEAKGQSESAATLLEQAVATLRTVGPEHRVIARMLEKDPARRHESCAELIDHLDRVVV